MTSYIIGGPPRSGKSTLAWRLQKEKGVTVISHDYLVSAMQDGFPQLGIRQSEGERERVGGVMLDFMKYYMWMHSDWGGHPFVVDTVHLTPEHICKAGLDKKYKVAFIGYSRIAVGEKLCHLRQYLEPRNDWTIGVEDGALVRIIEEMIESSQKVEKQCNDLGIPFFDTSEDFKGTLERAYEYLIGG